jgi:hypothetical protein|tara:strand:+ start:134 stop:283 length:150 start_codon:yes stop_codon:yes gene_type:complete
MVLPFLINLMSHYNPLIPIIDVMGQKKFEKKRAAHGRPNFYFGFLPVIV